MTTETESAVAFQSWIEQHSFKTERDGDTVLVWSEAKDRVSDSDKMVIQDRTADFGPATVKRTVGGGLRVQFIGYAP